MVLLKVSSMLWWLPAAHKAKGFDALCRSVASVPSQHRLENVLLLAHHVALLDVGERMLRLERTLHVISEASPEHRPYLLAVLATKAKYLTHHERVPFLRGITNVASALSLPGRRTPLTVALQESLGLPSIEQAALRLRCGVLWREGSASPPATLPLNPDLSAAINTAVHAARGPWLTGLVLKAVHTYGELDWSTGFADIFSAIQRLPPVDWARLMKQLFLHLASLAPEARLTMFERLLAATEQMPLQDHQLIFTTLFEKLHLLERDVQLTQSRNIFATMRRLGTGSLSPATLVTLNGFFGLIEPAVLTTLLEGLLLDIGRYPAEQQTPLLCTFSELVEHFPLAQQARAFGKIVEASASLPARRTVLALVWHRSHALSAAQRMALQTQNGRS